MNRTKVIKAIKARREEPMPCEPGSYLDNAQAAIEALEEIASEKNIEMLRTILKLNLDSLRGNISLVDYGKLINLMASVQVPKEVVYAYPVTMERHFEYYLRKWLQENDRSVFSVRENKYLAIHGSMKGMAPNEDAFGCVWKSFILPSEKDKALIDFLRENNVPIKVCE